MSPFSRDEERDQSELVRRAKSGDPAALGTLYDRYAEGLYRFGLARLGSAEAAEDLLQEVFVKVIEALPRYEDRGLPFGAWLFRIARNSTIDRARGATRVTPLDEAIALPDPAPGPQALAEARGDARLLRDALDRLTPEQREVIELRFFAGLDGAEIGALMGRREGTVRALQFRALGALRRAMADAVPESAPGRATRALLREDRA